jgi:hypothetical protein
MIMIGDTRQCREHVGLDLNLVALSKHGEDKPHRALAILHKQNAPAALRLRPRQGDARRSADLRPGGHAQHHFVVERLETGQILDASDEGDVVHRLGDEVVGAGLKALHSIAGLVQRGHHDDRHVFGPRCGLDASAHLEAVHARHHDVEQHHVHALALQYL